MRKPGDRISGLLVRDLRTRARLTQQQFAERIGAAGKGVISGWERDGCDGPAAELILRLFGGLDGDARAIALSRSMDALWDRSGPPLWHEVLAMPAEVRTIPDVQFAGLFPGAEIPPTETAFGFPFGPHDLPPSVISLGAEAWLGRIPPKDDPVAYAWTLDRGAQFVYREKAWDLERREIGCNLHLISLIENASLLVFFAGRLADQLRDPPTAMWHLGISVNGLRGKGLVAPDRHTGTHADLVDAPQRLSADNIRRTVVSAPVDSLSRRPVEVIIGLVAEFVAPLRPDLAGHSRLEAELSAHHAYDARVRGHRRVLGFLDHLLPQP